MIKLSVKQIQYITVFEIIIATILYFFSAWVIVPRVFGSLFAFYTLWALILLAAVYYGFISPFFIHNIHARERGLGLNYFTELFLSVLPVTFMASAAIIFIAWHNNSEFFTTLDWHSLYMRWLIYLGSAFFQDILFFSLILTNLKYAFSKSRLSQIIILLFFSTVFFLFHFPNIPLMFLTFIFAFILGGHYYRNPNLYVIILVHSILGTLLNKVYMLHMKIGIFYGTKGPWGPLVHYLLSSQGS